MLLSLPAEAEYKHWHLQGTSVHLAVVDVTKANVQVVLAEGTDPRSGRWRSESFGHMVSRLKPTAAINGTYFDMATNIPVCSIVSDGRLLVNGLCHSYLMIGDRASIGYCPEGKAHFVCWPVGLQVGMAGGPILVRDGKLHPNKRDEGFNDRGIFGSARRSAVGVTRAGKLVMLATNNNIGLSRWSRVCLEAGLTDAFNLDGGGSTGLYVGGMKCWPSRRLTSFLVVR